MRDLTALVIDDDKSLAQGFAIALQYCGFTVQHISDATQAIPTIEALRPDVVTLDLNMPQVSGIDILKTIRQMPEMTHIKVLVTTASVSLAQDPIVVELADTILMKPVNLAQFTSFARRFAERQRNQEMINGSTEV